TRSTLTVVTLASLALIAGCCSGKHTGGTAYYSTPAPVATTPAPETQYVAAPAGTNMVVPLYAEQLNVGKREIDNGSVTLKKIVKTETVNQPVELRREELVIERQSGGAAVQGQPAFTGQPFQEQETTIHLKREVAVVEKATAQSGQVVLSTRS